MFCALHLSILLTLILNYAFPRTPTTIPNIRLVRIPWISTTPAPTTLAHFTGLRFACVLDFATTMSSDRKCCVPFCSISRDDNIPLHRFPHPVKDADRFRSWLYAIGALGSDILRLDNEFIFKYRKVCHKHFEVKYHTWTSRLAANAIPTLHMQGSRQPMTDITNQQVLESANITTVNDAVPSTSRDVPEALNFPTLENVAPSTSKETKGSRQPMTDITNQQVLESANVTTVNESQTTSSLTKPSSSSKLEKMKKVPEKSKQDTVKNLQRVVKKLQKKNDTYATRLKKALKLSENKTFLNCLKKFTTLSALFTVMQFREIKKEKMGRRFTRDEKIMALSIYKQGPKAYRWLSKIFILPSPLTLSRLIGQAGIKPGINKNIFNQLKKRVQKMKMDEKLCILLFDEIKIEAHFDYNNRYDKISGFVTNGTTQQRRIADHALVFMIRGVVKNYKQPIGFTFCKGATPTNDLKIILKNMISELQGAGFSVIATICDQGTANVSTINKLVDETKAEYLRRGKVMTSRIFEVNGEEIIPLYDAPHLMKGIRNNLLTKKLKCVIGNENKTADWNHILQLYAENPAYKGIRLIKNLTEAHVNPVNKKMKVKYATQVFSKTVACNMGYLADKGILPKECKETADVLLFFDELFDSMNGSHRNSQIKSGKVLLRAVTPNSLHSATWASARKVLSSMKFYKKNGQVGSVPSITNWRVTLENIEYLKEKLFHKYNVKSFWMRHFNQDPLENFFGCIRSHGYRNNSPSPSGFETAFASLLINNITNYHSPGSNCEDDFAERIDCLDNLFNENDKSATKRQIIEIDFQDIEENVFENVSEKLKNPVISAQLHYVSGYILRRAQVKVFKHCKTCKENLFTNSPHEYLSRREYLKNKQCLKYPSKEIVIFFSNVQDIVTTVLAKKSEMPLIKNYMKTLIDVVVDYAEIFKCENHKKDLITFVADLSCRFFIYNWCRDVNNILKGTRKNEVINDSIKKLSQDYFMKKKKK